jgi:hypothetical protein
MRPVVYGAIALALWSSPAAAAKFAMQLNAGAEQIGRMESGVAAVDNSTPGSSVRLIQAEGDVKKRGSFGVLVMNQGVRPFNFGPENITAKLADGTPIAIITYEQLVKEEKRRQTWRAVAAGMAAAGNSMSAANTGYYSGTGTYTGSTYGTFGSTPYNSTTTGTVMVSGYDYGRSQAAQAAANAQNQATFARMAEQNAASMKGLKAYMRTTTVDPQQMFGGSLMFELPKSARDSKSDVAMTFAITINGEEHKFGALLKRH